MINSTHNRSLKSQRILYYTSGFCFLMFTKLFPTLPGDSGRWGKGGLFSALSSRSLQPQTQYELAGQMKDLELGDAHLVPIDDLMCRDVGNDMVCVLLCVCGVCVVGGGMCVVCVWCVCGGGRYVLACVINWSRQQPDVSYMSFSFSSMKVALIVAQKREPGGHVSGIKLSALSTGLQRVARLARRKRGI